MEEVVGRSTGSHASHKLLAVMSSLLGSMGILLLVASIYGILTQAVQEHQHEIAVRIALGATRRNVIFVVLRNVVAVATIGLALGLTLAASSTFLLRSVVFQIEPTDPTAWLVLAGVLVISTLAACIPPILRAFALDPARLFRSL